MRLSHKRKIIKKRFGTILKRYELREVGTPFFQTKPGTGKNTIHSMVIGLTGVGKGKGKTRFDPIQSLTTTTDVTKRCSDVVNDEANFINNIDNLPKNIPQG